MAALRYNLVVRDPETLEPVSLLAGTNRGDIPKWAADLVGDEDFGDAPAADGGDDLSSLSVDELQAKADDAGLEVEGTGANGRVLKGDLVAALEGNTK